MDSAEPAGLADADRSARAELAEVRAQLRQARETIEAIRGGGGDSVLTRPAEKRLQAIFEHAMTGIGEITPNGEFVWVNSYFCQLTGYTQDELRSMRVQDIVFPDDRDADLAGMQRLRSGEIGSYSTVKRYLRKDGSVVWAEVNRALVHDETGTPLIVGTVRDMTAQREAEAEARAAAAYNRSLIEASQDPMMAIDADGKITDVNAAAEGISGYRRSELLGSEFSGYFTDPDRALAGYEQTMRDGNVRDFALEVRHRDGQVTPLLCSATVYREPSGSRQGILAAGHDMTEINRTGTALRESQERLAALFDNAPVGIDELALDGSIVRANPRFCEITGYSADELMSMQVEHLIHPDDLATVVAGVESLVSGEADSYTTGRRFLRRDG